MDQSIRLKFDKTLTGLAGYQFGASTYRTQVQDKICFENNITIEFPENIQRIASSFIQGFFEDIMNHIGIEGIEKKVTIISSRADMKKNIIQNLL